MEQDLDALITTFDKMKVVDLKQKAKQMGLSGYSKLRKADLVKFIGQESLSKSMMSKKLKSPSIAQARSPVSLVKVAISPSVSRVASPKVLSPRVASPRVASPRKSPSPRASLVSVSKKQPSVKRYRIQRKIGPSNDPNKYGLIKVLGKGNYGETHKVVNLNPKQGEDEFYALKIIFFDSSNPARARKNWEREVKCLDEVYHLCHQIGILCYKESFIVGNEFVIVTSLLDKYLSLFDYLFKRKSKKGRDYNLTRPIVEKIYSDVIEVKNALTKLCINHSDLHAYNIMIEPKTKDVKVIDFGRCQTPEEEIKEWQGDQQSWNTYSDDARLDQLLMFLFQGLQGKGYGQIDNKNPEFIKFEKELKSKYPIDPYIQGCKRK
jgi:hypothetical protein